MVVANLAVVHVGIALARIQTVHHIRVVSRPDRTIVIRRATLVVVAALHGHAREGYIVLRGHVPGQSDAGKEVPSAVVALTLVVLVFVGLQVFLFTDTAAAALALAEAEVGKGVEHPARVVEVAACVPAAGIVGADAQRTIIARLTVALQHDVDDTCRSLGRELRTGVVDHLDALDALCGYLLQDLSAVVTRQSGGLTVDPHLDTRVAAQRDLTVGGHLDTRNLLQQLRGRTACRGDHLVDGKRLAVDFEFHLRTLTRDGNLRERLGVLGQIEGVEVRPAVVG